MPGDNNQTSPPSKMSNGYILPEGKLTPSTMFVGGLDVKVNENEMRDFFARYAAVKEVKIIKYRGGVCKGYGFVHFNEDVNIQSIIDQQITFKGRKLKLGPAIMKNRRSRPMPANPVGPAPWASNAQLIYFCCPRVPVGMAQPSPMVNGGNPYYQQPQLYSYSNFGGAMIPQMPVDYAQMPVDYAQMPVDYAQMPVDYAQMPVDYAQMPVDYTQMPVNYAQNANVYQYTPPSWMADQKTPLVNQSSVDSGAQTVLTVL